MPDGLDEQLAPGRPMSNPPHTTTRPFCLDAHLRALDECSIHKNERSHLFIQPRKRPFKSTTFPFLDTTATNERTPDSIQHDLGREYNFPHSMTLEAHTPLHTASMLPTFDKTHSQSLLSLLLLLVCDLYIRREFFSSPLLCFHRGIGFFNGLKFFQSARMDTSRFYFR
jgi:hypothetical protein